ncbi:Na+/H+ antiporter subunit G [Hahella aquimaris]|uniref:Na+/H+ antiporter subunit G n=1 Tax=Hahella sp. HNIBRBA332 TaxID=3015983 RepID=UPI00273BCB0C|nr:Na+/H+ antiporter subunit G [Hahella sp. HNIBRBA332]WLQ12432.1 Na+/H+ antiporter subunit G [Hahella sp. HNIBRBA332]
MSFTVELIICALVLLGGLFALLGSIGVLKMSDFYTRLHAPTLAATVGMGSLLIASIIAFTVREQSLSAHELLITLFVMITAPVTAHMLAKVALHQRQQSVASTQNQALTERIRKRLPPE